MKLLPGWAARGRALFNDTKGPWGPTGTGGGSSGDGTGDGGGDEPPASKGPWGDQPKRRRPSGPSSPVTSLDDFLKRSRGRFAPNGGGGGGFSGRPNRSIISWAVVAVALLWLLTCFHSIASAERGVVTRFGRYSHTLGPGVGLTLPFPIDRVRDIDVDEIREIPLGSASEETLMLTGDQNIIDLAYIVRWKIRDPEQFLFELVEPEDTIKQVAESSMRAVVANVTLQGAIGNQRGEIAARVAEEMQQTLDSYKAGVTIQGVSIRQADPPAAVNDAFKEVTAAQQDAQSYINNANAYALQLRQKAQGDATSFDKVYEQYRLAPEVTKRRMYYETMEQVLKKVDKTIVEAPGVNSYLPLNELKRTPAVREPAQ
ncbi:MAG TPA: FtsH protease activity modulator HflK [Sphingomicrobium sp.]|nr:FtsH protease activity modulator HflK [Sphingomicrobium sp.]